MTQAKELCSTCRAPKAVSPCECCREPVCRNCVQLLGEEAFELLPEKPEALSKTRYCQRCFDQQVAPELEAYQGIVERARQVAYLPSTYRMHVPVLKKAKAEIKVAGLADQDQVIMRLAYIAARDGYNALIHAEVTAKKVRNHGYQKSEWSGHALPAEIDEARLNRDEYREEVWRRGH